MCFFKVKHFFGQISGMVGPIDVKRKGSASVRYWVWYVTLTFDLTHDLDLVCFKVKLRNSCISGIVGLIDVKWKGSELIWYWAHCMTLPLDHTHDLDLGVSRSEYEIAISQELGAADWHGTKRMWVIINSWPWCWLVWPWCGGRLYRIVNGVTSDVSVPSTYSFVFVFVVITSMSISSAITCRWMMKDPTDEKSTLAQLMAWCRQATSHYLSQSWPRSKTMSPYDVT